MELFNLTIKQLHKKLLDREISAVELTKVFLSRIDKIDKNINAFLDVFNGTAIFQAEEIDKRISEKKEISLLAGIPMALKDNILVKDKKCTAASKILENYIAPYDATCVKKLKKAGAIFLGKTNLDEFAMGSSTENSAFKITHNPQDLTCVPGGSSGGSAAAVKANECVFALGSDTGGSIRQPASLCGTVGFKPTYGTVSRYGLIAFASSLDQIGPLTKNIEDAEIVFDSIKGKDKKDSTSIKLESKKSDFNLKGIKIGLPKEYFQEGLDPKIERIIKDFIKKIEEQGLNVEEISLPHTKYAIPCYFLLSSCEASANLSRYDGIKYGKSNMKEKELNILDIYLKTRGQGFGDEVKRRIMLGTYALSSGYYDAYYLRAEKVRTLIKQDFEKAFTKVDIILAPTSPFTAFKIGEKVEDALSMYLADAFTTPSSLAGLPALSMPCGEINNLPVGLQVIGKSFKENEIFKAASFFEKIITNN
jgi:aspartyl-tRNA(Asn)/glutamyl-tRNA(Gln) amidotransferase subunit A